MSWVLERDACGRSGDGKEKGSSIVQVLFTPHALGAARTTNFYGRLFLVYPLFAAAEGNS